MDVICCGFGAIVLLLVITETSEPAAAISAQESQEVFVKLQEQLDDIADEETKLAEELTKQQQQSELENDKIAQQLKDIEQVIEELKKSEKQLAVNQVRKDKISTTKSKLASKLGRLPKSEIQKVKESVAGIPLDSDYIIFIIDTSGSMRSVWNLMIETVRQILEVYPKVRGLQIMNDQGQYLYASYRDSWIPDTPPKRRSTLRRLETWTSFSNSSPVEGIEKAIRTYHKMDANVAIYVLGDEFTGNSITAVLETIDRLNTGHNQNGEQRQLMRIHAIGFPVQLQGNVPNVTGIRFATLMRELTRRNGGAFVGLSKVDQHLFR